ncbi:hypothetical protein PHLCEN_2v4199 [Hermanssonia centrifuga]|uniref:Uncharacterized protein n=1 Tax=Hermanssonia centrifuga TaxID=98765 RepID=A0A2R6PYX4_9APHY|nr:hypothetical protein PHLCEN_2v4199 [Hermanssonia centrifuga]
MVSKKGPRYADEDVHTAMHAEDLVVNYDRESQIIEHIGEISPHMWRTILPHTLRVEPIGLGADKSDYRKL